MASLNRNDVTAFLAAVQAGIQQPPPVDKHNEIDPAMDPEIQTDKQSVKVIGCRECKRPLVVTTFYAAAKGICASCNGTAKAEGNEKGTVGQPTPGSTDPAKAVNLADCLINKQFASAVCPLCMEDMELKMISHSDQYGPRLLQGYDAKNIPQYRQEVGESVTFQCNACKCVVSMSTQHQHTYKRQNEAKKRPDSMGQPVMASLLGTREEVAA